MSGTKILIEATTTVLFLLCVAIIGFYLYDQFVISIVLILVLAILLLQKIRADDEITKDRKRQKNFILLISERTEKILKSTETVVNELNKKNSDTTEKVYELRHLYEVESKQQYNELSKKILELENTITETKKNMLLALSLLEDKIRQEKGI